MSGAQNEENGWLMLVLLKGITTGSARTKSNLCSRVVPPEYHSTRSCRHVPFTTGIAYWIDTHQSNAINKPNKTHRDCLEWASPHSPGKTRSDQLRTVRAAGSQSRLRLMTVQRQLASVSTSSQDRDEQTHSGGNCSSWWLSLWQACFITLSVRGVVFNTQLHSGLQGALRRWGVTLRPRSEAAHRTRASSCWAVSANCSLLRLRHGCGQARTHLIPCQASDTDVWHALTRRSLATDL